MCCQIVIPGGVEKPSLETFLKIEKIHNDGAGFAYINKKGFVEFKKGLTANEVFNSIKDIKSSIAIHFRKQTCGEKLKELSHPFTISRKSPLKLSGQARKVLFHNGTFSDWKLLLAAANIKINEKENWSDSRGLAVLQSIHKDYDFLTYLDRITAGSFPYQKFIVIDSLKKSFKMVGFFHKINDVFYSKLDWQYQPVSYPSHANNWQDDFDDRGWYYDAATSDWKQREKPKVIPVNNNPSSNGINKINLPTNAPINYKVDLSSEGRKRFKRDLEQKRFWIEWLKYEQQLDDKEYQLNQNDLKSNNLTNDGSPIIEAEEVPVRIHEKPQSFFEIAAQNTRKVLGLPAPKIKTYGDLLKEKESQSYGHGSFSDI